MKTAEPETGVRREESEARTPFASRFTAWTTLRREEN